MNDKQKQAIRWGIGIGIAMILIPPWHCHLGTGFKTTVYQLLFEAPQLRRQYALGCQIDTFQLLIQLVALCIIIGGFVLTWKDWS